MCQPYDKVDFSPIAVLDACSRFLPKLSCQVIHGYLNLSPGEMVSGDLKDLEKFLHFV